MFVDGDWEVFTELLVMELLDETFKGIMGDLVFTHSGCFEKPVILLKTVGFVWMLCCKRQLFVLDS